MQGAATGAVTKHRRWSFFDIDIPPCMKQARKHRDRPLDYLTFDFGTKPDCPTFYRRGHELATSRGSGKVGRTDLTAARERSPPYKGSTLTYPHASADGALRVGHQVSTECRSRVRWVLAGSGFPPSLLGYPHER